MRFGWGLCGVSLMTRAAQVEPKSGRVELSKASCHEPAAVKRNLRGRGVAVVERPPLHHVGHVAVPVRVQCDLRAVGVVQGREAQLHNSNRRNKQFHSQHAHIDSRKLREPSNTSFHSAFPVLKNRRPRRPWEWVHQRLHAPRRIFCPAADRRVQRTVTLQHCSAHTKGKVFRA